MKKLILLAVLIIAGINLSAQQKVALQSEGTTTIFGGTQPFVDAYTAAISGDTLYLPGTPLTFPPVIDKSLVIFGSGHYPDSTAATGRTVLYGNLSIGENADNLFMEGIEISGTLSTALNAKVDYITISRSKLNTVNYQGTMATPCEYSTIKECVITGEVTLSNMTSSVLANNLIHGRIYNGNSNAIYNNILFFSGSTYYATLNNVDNSTISNNIFLKPNNVIHSTCESSTFSNNVFGYTIGTGSNTFNINYFDVDLSTLFVNQTGYVFDYLHDYHLNSPATYPGTDGTEVSLYGGLFPYKTSAVPSNPHISDKTISSTTDENGLLNIEVKATAQQK